MVIPQALRAALGLVGGEELEIVARDGRLEIEPVAAVMRVEEQDGRPVIVAGSEMPLLTTADVRAVLDQLRR